MLNSIGRELGVVLVEGGPTFPRLGTNASVDSSGVCTFPFLPLYVTSKRDDGTSNSGTKKSLNNIGSR